MERSIWKIIKKWYNSVTIINPIYIMQYKIPVQIENEDPIVLWLSLRQLAIIIAGGWIWYSLFSWLYSSIWTEFATVIAISIFLIFLMIAIFKFSEMTFIPFILAAIRYKINNPNINGRIWMKWIDSFQPIDIWYISNIENKKDENIDFKDKIDKIKELDDKLNKI